MPGENIGATDGPWLTYLRILQEYGHRFPGFAKEVEGTEERDGVYHIYCLTPAAPSRRSAAVRREETPGHPEESDEPELVSAGAGTRGRGTPVGAGSGAGSRKRHSG
jgi:hypothetical protein